MKKENTAFIDDCVRQKAKMKSEQKKRARKLVESIYAIRNDVKKSSEIMVRVQDGTETERDLLRFQELGTCVQDGIKKLKLESRKEYQELAVEEHGLTSDLELLSEKFDAILTDEKESSAVSAPRPRVASAKKRATSAAASRRLSGAPKPPSNPELTVLKAEIDHMDDQLFSLGGFNLGWRACDHQDFLRLYTKYGPYRVSSLSFLNDVLSVVPGQTVDTVKEHLGKYEDQQ